MKVPRQPRIRIEDLSPTPLEAITPEEAALIFGAGRSSFKPGMEALEERYMPSATSMTALPAVTGFTAAAVQTNSSEITVSWNAVKGASSYQVQEQVGNGLAAVKFADTLVGVGSPGKTQATDEVIGGLSPGTKYTFEVQALGANGTAVSQEATASATTNTLAATMSVTAQVVKGTKTIDLSWNAVTGSKVSYQVQTFCNGSWVPAKVSSQTSSGATLLGPNATQAISEFDAGTTYQFRVAVSTSTSSAPAYSNVALCTTAAAQPQQDVSQTVSTSNSSGGPNSVSTLVNDFLEIDDVVTALHSSSSGAGANKGNSVSPTETVFVLSTETGAQGTSQNSASVSPTSAASAPGGLTQQKQLAVQLYLQYANLSQQAGFAGNAEAAITYSNLATQVFNNSHLTMTDVNLYQLGPVAAPEIQANYQGFLALGWTSAQAQAAADDLATIG